MDMNFYQVRGILTGEIIYNFILKREDSTEEEPHIRRITSGGTHEVFNTTIDKNSYSAFINNGVSE